MCVWWRVRLGVPGGWPARIIKIIGTGTGPGLLRTRQLITQLPTMAVVTGSSPKGTCSVGSQRLLHNSPDRPQESTGSEDSPGTSRERAGASPVGG